jgi:hypothetical protein
LCIRGVESSWPSPTQERREEEEEEKKALLLFI